MAVLSTDTNTQQSSDRIRSRADGSRVNGTLRMARATYVATGNEAAGDVINIVQLPVGAMIVASKCRVSSDGVGGTGAAVASIGDAGNASRYSATSITVSSAATSLVTPQNAIAVVPYAISAGNETVTATLALTSGSLTAGKLISFLIAYIDHP